MNLGESLKSFSKYGKKENMNARSVGKYSEIRKLITSTISNRKE